MILVDVVVGGLEDDVRAPLLPERDEQLEDVLAALGNVRTSKSCTVRCESGIPSSAVASRTSRASVSGANPGGNERVAIENAT